MGKRALLVELNNWHGECLYSTAKNLNDKGYTVDIVLNERFKEQQIDPLEEVSSSLQYIPCEGWGWVKVLFSLYSKLKHFDVLYFNTIQGSKVLQFCLFPFPIRCKMWGTLHSAKKLKTSFGVKHIISSRTDRFFVLAEYVKKYAEQYTKKPIETFYCTAKPQKQTHIELPQKGEDIWFVIPGAISTNRREYNLLLPQDGIEYPANVKFLILGKYNEEKAEPAIKELFSNPKIAPHLMLFNRYVGQDEFNAFIAASDYLLPLLSTSNPKTANYFVNKISGTFNLGLMHKVKMINPVEVKGIDPFFSDENSLFCKDSELPAFICEIAKQKNA